LVSGHEENGDEPDGVRYRNHSVRGTDTVYTSVFGYGGTTLVMLTR